MQLRGDRAAWLLLFLLVAAMSPVIGAVIPENTFKHDEGAAMPLFNATGPGYYVGGVQVIDGSRAATFTTIDTGQGANELYDMDQNVQTTDDVTFASIDTGQGAGELYPGDQYVNTSSSPTFTNLTLNGPFINEWNLTEHFDYPGLPYSYVIGIVPGSSPSVYYAKSGTTGAIDYSGSDADVVIQAAIDAAGDDSDVKLRNGTYMTDATINVPYTDFGLIFEKGATIQYSGNGVALRAGGAASHEQRIVFRDPAVYCTGANSVCMEVTSTESQFYNPRLVGHSTGVGLKLRPYSTGGYAVYYNDFYSAIIEAAKYGIVLEKNTKRVNANHFYGGRIGCGSISGSIAIYFNGTNVGDTNSFSDMGIESAETGISISTSSYRNWFQNIRIESVTLDATVQGNYNIFSSCNFANSNLTVSGAGNRFLECGGFVTESYGRTTVAYDEWVAHGLAGSPDAVQLALRTPVYDGVQVVVGYTAWNATKFKVRCYWVNGTAITSDAIQIDYHAYYQP